MRKLGVVVAVLGVLTVSLHAAAVPPSGPAASPVVTPPAPLPIDRIARLESNAAADAAKISALEKSAAADSARISALETKVGNLDTKIGTLEKVLSLKLYALETNQKSTCVSVCSLKCGTPSGPPAQQAVVSQCINSCPSKC